MSFFESKIKIRTHIHKEYSPSILSGFIHAIFWLPYSVGLLIVTVVAGLAIAVLSLCNAVGLALLWSPKLISRFLTSAWDWLVQDIKNTVLLAPTHVRFLKQRQFAFGLVIFLGVVLSVFGTLEVGSLLAHGVDLKGRVLGQVSNAISKLEDGRQDILGEDLESAQNKFGQAIEQFRQSGETIQNGNALFSGLLKLLPTGRDAKKLLEAGEAGTEAILHITNFAKQLTVLRMGEDGFKTGSTDALKSARSELDMARVDLAGAMNASSGVDISNIPEQYQDKFNQIISLEKGLSTSLETLSDTFDVLSVLTHERKHLLVLLQNSNELRPTGGFIGTFGAFELENGVVEKRNISSIYDLDGQLQSKFIPPLPMFAVNNRWFLRDSNWFASFPESAEAIKSFYKEESGINPDFILAITPKLAKDLLELTGPVYLPNQDITLDVDNFIEVTQVETSINYDKTENKPKQMLADLFPVLLSKVISLSHVELPKLLAVLEQSLASKDILIYSSDKHASQVLAKLGFDGRLADTGRDYLSIVSSNLGGTKTDLAIKQAASLDTTFGTDGRIVNTLKIRRENPLPHTEGLENKDFMRVYVPLGSKLLSAKGFSYVNVDAKYGSKGDMHPQVQEWENNAIKEVGSGMLVGVESGKTFFGNWVVLEGGQSQTVELVYELPFKLGTIDRYGIVVQKQPGANIYALKYNLKISDHRILWSTDSVLTGDSIEKEMEISRDRFYGTVLQAY